MYHALLMDMQIAVCRKENGDIFSTLEKNGAAQTERGFPNKETNGEKEFYEIVFQPVFPCNIYST